MPHYNTKGTCAKQIIYTVENDILTDVKFINGCSGNTQGIGRLVAGMHIDAVIEKLKGIKCRGATSCPDQLALALIEYKEKQTSAVVPVLRGRREARETKDKK